jgi:hypothetical protein
MPAPSYGSDEFKPAWMEKRGMDRPGLQQESMGQQSMGTPRMGTPSWGERDTGVLEELYGSLNSTNPARGMMNAYFNFPFRNLAGRWGQMGTGALDFTNRSQFG